MNSTVVPPPETDSIQGPSITTSVFEWLSQRGLLPHSDFSPFLRKWPRNSSPVFQRWRLYSLTKYISRISARGRSYCASAGGAITHLQAEPSHVRRHCFVTPTALSRPIAFPIMLPAPTTQVGAELC